MAVVQVSVVLMQSISSEQSEQWLFFIEVVVLIKIFPFSSHYKIPTGILQDTVY